MRAVHHPQTRDGQSAEAVAEAHSVLRVEGLMHDGEPQAGHLSGSQPVDPGGAADGGRCEGRPALLLPVELRRRRCPVSVAAAQVRKEPLDSKH